LSDEEQTPENVWRMPTGTRLQAEYEEAQRQYAGAAILQEQ
jgi:hypothetical protein